MLVEDTENTRKLQNVVASMAIENMYLSKDFINELLKAGRGEKTYDALRQEVIQKYAG